MLKSHWWKAHEEKEDGSIRAKKSPQEADVVIGPGSKDLTMKEVRAGRLGHDRAHVIGEIQQWESMFMFGGNSHGQKVVTAWF